MVDAPLLRVLPAGSVPWASVWCARCVQAVQLPLQLLLLLMLPLERRCSVVSNWTPAASWHLYHGRAYTRSYCRHGINCSVAWQQRHYSRRAACASSSQQQQQQQPWGEETGNLGDKARGEMSEAEGPRGNPSIIDRKARLSRISVVAWTFYVSNRSLVLPHLSFSFAVLVWVYRTASFVGIIAINYNAV